MRHRPFTIKKPIEYAMLCSAPNVIPAGSIHAMPLLREIHHIEETVVRDNCSKVVVSKRQ